LSRYEVCGQPEQLDDLRRVRGLDYDRNGTLVARRMALVEPSFTQRDTNRDGVISKREFEASGGAPWWRDALRACTRRCASTRSSAGPTPASACGRVT
jgi:hypothetical protein